MAGQGGRALALVSSLERLSHQRLLDRLIRGRTWIGIVAFALIGIVTLQLGLLKLNGGIGRALARQAVLQRENAALSIENSELAAADRVQAKAAQVGMEFAPAGALRFLSGDSRTAISRARSVLSAPLHPSSARAEEVLANTGSSGSTGEAEASHAAPSTTPGSSEAQSASSGPAGPTSPRAEGATSQPAPSPAGSEAGRGEATTGRGEASRGEAATSRAAAPEAPSTSQGATATSTGSSEASPAGGTQAAPGG